MSLAQGLGQQASARDLQVTVVTAVPSGSWSDRALPFRVVRQPGVTKLVGLIRDCDILHLAGPTFLPLLFGLLFRKQVLVEHSGYQAVCPNGLLLDERTKTVCPGHFMSGQYGECVRCNAGNVGAWKSLAMLLFTFPRRWMCARIARNVYPSHHIGQRVMLPRGVHIFHGTPDLPAPPQGAATDGSVPPFFVFVGRLVPEKGVSILLRAAEVLMRKGLKFQLKIIGDGPGRPALEEMANRCGLGAHTTFTGPLRGDALQDAMRDCAASVIPSTWEDVAPVAAIELMMQGRALIASDIGGLGELVGDAGLRFPPGDVDGLASCLQRVLDEPTLGKALGEKARQKALQFFREERMVAEHLALYCGLVVNPNQAAEEEG